MTRRSPNPFRNPSGQSTQAAVTPNTTGISSSSTLTPEYVSSASDRLERQGALNSAPATSASATPTMTSAPSSSSTTATQAAENRFTTSAIGNPHRVDPLDITEDDPPAYTPGPDVHRGEATVELGPGRPFQPPPQQPPQRHPLTQPRPPQHPGWSAIQNHVVPPSTPPTLLQQITGNLVDRLNNMSTGGNTYNYNRYEYPGNSRPPPRPSGYPPPPGPPPSHLAQQNTGPAQQYYSPPLNPPPASDFARDFYQAGSGPNPQSSEGNTAPSRASTTPSGPGVTADPSSGQPPASANDNRPTQTPAPGHPLLNDGKLLVYPAGFTCRKCNNIGYKKADPRHPCKKCWSKYAKPFAGALSYSDFSPNASTGSGTTFQKPLPMQNPAQPVGPGPSNGYPGAAAHYQQSHPPPIPFHTSFPPHRPPPPLQHPSIVVTGPGYRPYPPGSIVYKPGDARIGGQMCWKCDGDGMVDMLFWEDRCDVCGGTGRIFR
ncbi:hypothetical protein E1B28_007284 [Marasmius oreades]|uniref:Uncharacterized protein n=1 Tax=Marasmius oreades TaxID=181124 RepID=A0A9P7UTW0_9AGAR|nr:uncharacterized protein E1B28_007284 [Marasmius oreades]KAG7093620.1 hypothetical protein E1B28_007284 [Marasmius oreades]